MELELSVVDKSHEWYPVLVHFPFASACAVRPNASIQTASIRSAGHFSGAFVVGGREVVVNKCNEGIQLRISFTEHEENDVDEVRILLSNGGRMN